MSGPDIAAIIVAVASLLTAIGTLVVSVATALRLSSVQRSVNGHTDRLVEVTKLASFAAGVQAERETPGNVGKTPTDIVGNSPTTE